MSDGPMHYVRTLPERIVDTWVQEFGYTGWKRDDIIRDRGLVRWATELNIHAKRLADNAKMGAGTPRITGRAGVIR